ncbi:MAG: TonB-dependent receptor plug domain-containing protein [Flavobacteriaceae bacterium]|nr:TonB-dependent receptor plug domain-containing protein [Flavobacteriaceae bacterium]
MQNKDLEKEIAFLDNYLVNIKEVEINLIVFSNTISLEKKYQINNANWADLKEILQGITYDGMALYENIGNANSADINLLFTDGFAVIDKLNLESAKPTYIISSSKNAMVNLLKRQSNISNANYINLLENNIKEALLLFDFEPNKILLVDDLQIFDDKQLENNTIQGIVYSKDGVLIGAEIKVKGKSTATTTNENGKFLIHANKGDVLEIKYLGMETRDLLIVKLKFYDVLLLDGNSELDEIILEGAYKDPTVNTGYGKKDKEKIGYAVQSVSGEDLSLARPDNIALQGKFSGVNAYGQNDDISQMVLRGNSLLLNIYPLIVLDGTPLRRSNSVTGQIQISNFINPANIANITILKGLVATNRWGSEGANGVILITTLTATHTKSKDSKPFDRALVRDNDYEENLSAVNTSIRVKYMDEIIKVDGIVKKYAFYLKNRTGYKDDFQYYINMSNYFLQLGYKDLSTKVLTNILEKNIGDLNNLRFVALKAEENKDFELVEKIYLKIAELKPLEPQSYRDLALIYTINGKYNKALNIYLNIKQDKFVGVNFSGLMKNINNEMRHLILNQKSELTLTGVPKAYYNYVQYDARIVFEWNDRDADFEFQFVNPKKKFFIWSHTKDKNASRIIRENNQGFNAEEFLLTGVGKGEWIINIESNIKSNNEPVAVKYTVFKNFGKANETIESKLLLLNNISGKYTIGRIKI